ncbi:DUF6783 domain-containing protein [Hungatella hathewayi]
MSENSFPSAVRPTKCDVQLTKSNFQTRSRRPEHSPARPR